MELLAVALLGVAAGVVAGLFGVGGGVIFVPALTLVVGLSQLHAEATSLLAIVPVALLGSWQQRRHGHIRWRDAGVIGAASVVTAIAGAFIADAAPERVLRIAFAALLVVTAAQLCLRSRRDARARAAAAGPPPTAP
ncbi:MAG: sulfite exporter TauE/SafE family protein [Thermoleophilia bacterium]|nr:sulfite exporter TauE/SafE family protein [Thermoleophilia bacterium]